MSTLKKRKAARLARIESERPERAKKLWYAAKAYIYDQIDAMEAIDIKTWSIAGHVKSVEVDDWVKAIWVDYKARKDTYLIGGDLDLDFSNHENRPHSYWDCEEEALA